MGDFTVDLLFPYEGNFVAKEGWLQRAEDGVWKKRWVVFSKKKIYIYKMKNVRQSTFRRLTTYRKIR